MYKLNEYMTVKKASEYLGVCEMTLRRWDNSGKLKSYRHPFNKYRLYNKLQLENFKKEILFPSSPIEKKQKINAERKEHILMETIIKRNLNQHK